jgi:hypothetical protein
MVIKMTEETEKYGIVIPGEIKQGTWFTFSLSVDILEEGSNELITTIDLSESDVKTLINYSILDILKKQISKENKKTKKAKEN